MGWVPQRRGEEKTKGNPGWLVGKGKKMGIGGAAQECGAQIGGRSLSYFRGFAAAQGSPMGGGYGAISRQKKETILWGAAPW